MKRYYIVSYLYELEDITTGYGHTTVQTGYKYVNLEDLSKHVRETKLINLKQIVILNIIRVSKKEHLEFMRK